MPYRSLDHDKIIKTAERLELRVVSRFADAGLANVAGEVVALARDTSAEAKRLEGPIWWLRVLLVGVVLSGALIFLYIGTFLSFDRLSGFALRSVESIEAVINTSILAALGLTFLVQTEARIKRSRVTKALHGLRSVIHVIDMHQLTKDPLAMSPGYVANAASPERPWTAVELTRYLDYCAEMLAITGKLAALFAQSVNDDGVAQAVNDIEMLGSTLSRKIWQKIMMLEDGADWGAQAELPAALPREEYDGAQSDAATHNEGATPTQE